MLHAHFYVPLLVGGEHFRYVTEEKRGEAFVNPRIIRTHVGTNT